MKWIFRYLDGARNETDMGPYDSKEEAQEKSDRMASFGAITSGAVEVSNDYKLYKPDYEEIESIPLDMSNFPNFALSPQSLGPMERECL